jgi:hypothetical protein
MKRNGFILFTLLCFVVGCAPVGSNYQRKDSVVPSRFGSLEKGVTTGEPLGNELLTIVPFSSLLQKGGCRIWEAFPMELSGPRFKAADMRR